MNTDLLIIYIRNSRDIYALTEWLQNTLLKKVNRGLTPSVEYLANCSTMKKIVRMAAKMLSDQDHKTATKQEKNKQQENMRPILSNAWNIFLNSNNNYFSGAVMAPGISYFSLFTL
jgi:hypothetical protein